MAKEKLRCFSISRIIILNTEIYNYFMVMDAVLVSPFCFEDTSVFDGSNTEY